MTQIKIATNLTRTKDWYNPRTRQHERVVIYPNGRREVTPIRPNGEIIKQTEEEVQVNNG